MAAAIPSDTAIIDQLVDGEVWTWGGLDICPIYHVSFGSDGRYTVYRDPSGPFTLEELLMQGETFQVQSGIFSFTQSFTQEDMTLLYESQPLTIKAVAPERLDMEGPKGETYTLRTCPEL
ncbi:MAG: hypothetical protein AAFX01_13925 [Cyanobacteria bacterium J06638_28]